jgi:hypothetical protein
MKRFLIVFVNLFLWIGLLHLAHSQDTEVELGENGKFYITDSEGNVLFICNSYGWVGVGTEQPNKNLTVVAPSGGDGISVVDNSGNTRILLSASQSMGFLELWGKKIDSQTSERAYITPWGSYFSDEDYEVGIGTDNPSANLHVAGTDGVVFTGTYGEGTIPMEGPGSRMMWYPAKNAFRVGNTIPGQWGEHYWDDDSIGLSSIAMGHNPRAIGNHSIAIGQGSWAKKYSAIALGSNSKAIGHDAIAIGPQTKAEYHATAIGFRTSAIGRGSTALGYFTKASGNYSTTMGYMVSTNNKHGSFIIGDYDPSRSTDISSDANNRFTAIFDNGYKLYTSTNLVTGAEMLNGANSWSTISDSTKKENLKTVDGEDFLNKIANFKLTSWNYKGQDPAQFRHYGPMAQEFYAAFGNDGIGTIGNDTTIASADFDGINLIAIQALEKRTTELQNENQMLKEKIENLNNKMAKYEVQIKEIQALKEQLNDIIQYSSNHRKTDADVSKELSLKH